MTPPYLPLLVVACAARAPAGDPAVRHALSLRALDDAIPVAECLRRDGVKADLRARVEVRTGRVVRVEVPGEESDATRCLTALISHRNLDPPVTGEASLIFADQSAEQDARTARDRVERVVHDHQSAIDACHQVALGLAEPGDPPAGKVVLAWDIEARKARRIRVMSNDTGSAELADCLVEEVGRWTFPPDAAGPVDWWFDFAGGDR